MGPDESRKRPPASWAHYDAASEVATMLTGATSLKAELPGTTVKLDKTIVIELLDLLRSLLRERIEADAKGG